MTDALENRRFTMHTNTSSILSRILLLLIPISVTAQTTEEASIQKLADVNVIVTDFKKVPRPGEQIIFISKKNGTKFSRKAGNDGKFALKLPTADTFVIKVKTIIDSTRYGVIAI